MPAWELEAGVGCLGRPPSSPRPSSPAIPATALGSFHVFLAWTGVGGLGLGLLGEVPLQRGEDIKMGDPGVRREAGLPGQVRQ